MGARASGMGNAFSAVSEDVTSIYWNPAGLSSLTENQLHLMHAELFDGIVKWDCAAFGYSLDSTRSLGIGLFRLGLDGIPLTTLVDPSKSLGEWIWTSSGRIRNVPVIDKTIDDSESALFLTYSKRGARHAYGVSIKVIRKSAGDYGAWGVGFDLGWRSNLYRNLTTAAVLTNATSTMIAWNGGRKEFAAPHLRIGLSNPFSFLPFQWIPVLEAEASMENLGDAAQWHSGRLGLDFRAGLEIGYNNRAWLRFGMDRKLFTMGTGFRFMGINADYGFSPHSDLGTSHRISMTVILNKDRFRGW
jgi:hypothetical protein